MAHPRLCEENSGDDRHPSSESGSIPFKERKLSVNDSAVANTREHPRLCEERRLDYRINPPCPWITSVRAEKYGSDVARSLESAGSVSVHAEKWKSAFFAQRAKGESGESHSVRAVVFRLAIRAAVVAFVRIAVVSQKAHRGKRKRHIHEKSDSPKQLSRTNLLFA